MAEFKLFTPEELAERSKPKRQQQREAKERTITAYAQALAAATPGFAGEIILAEDDDKRKQRALLKEAARRNAQHLRIRPIKNSSRIEFSILEPAQQPAQGGKGRGGRRKKTT